MAKKNEKNTEKKVDQKKADAVAKAETKAKAKDKKASDKQDRQTKRAKRQQAQMANKNKSKKNEKKGGLREYFKGVKTETKKVVWPTRKELVSYTIVVLFTCAFFGLAIWGIDSGFLAALRAVLGITL